MSSFITIDNLQIFAYHGVLEEENRVGNQFEVSVTVEFDIIPAAEADSIERALDYAELTRIVVDSMKQTRKLLETVAIDIQRRIMERWPEVKSGSISITKKHPPIPAPTPRATVTLRW